MTSEVGWERQRTATRSKATYRKHAAVEGAAQLRLCIEYRLDAGQLALECGFRADKVFALDDSDDSPCAEKTEQHMVNHRKCGVLRAEKGRTNATISARCLSNTGLV